MNTNDLIGIVVLLTLFPAMVGLLVWLSVVRPRRDEQKQRERAEAISLALGLPVVEPGRVAGQYGEASVGVSFRLSGMRTHPETVCYARVEPPFGRSFAIASPPVRAAGCTKRLAPDVAIGGPTPEALSLAADLAPIVQAEARPDLPGFLSLQLNRDMALVILDGHVLDAEKLRRALALATRVARKTRAAAPSA